MVPSIDQPYSSSAFSPQEALAAYAQEASSYGAAKESYGGGYPPAPSGAPAYGRVPKGPFQQPMQQHPQQMQGQMMPPAEMKPPQSRVPPAAPPAYKQPQSVPNVPPQHMPPMYPYPYPMYPPYMGLYGAAQGMAPQGYDEYQHQYDPKFMAGNYGGFPYSPNYGHAYSSVPMGGVRNPPWSAQPPYPGSMMPGVPMEQQARSYGQAQRPAAPQPNVSQGKFGPGGRGGGRGGGGYDRSMMGSATGYPGAPAPQPSHIPQAPQPQQPQQSMQGPSRHDPTVQQAQAQQQSASMSGTMPYFGGAPLPSMGYYGGYHAQQPGPS
eukprot:RCo018074